MNNGLEEAKAARAAIYKLEEDAMRYRALKARYVGADFTQPSPSGQGTRCVLIFAWGEREEVSADLDATVDRTL